MNQPVPLWMILIQATCSLCTIGFVALGVYLQVRSINRLAEKLRAELRVPATRVESFRKLQSLWPPEP